MTSSTSRALASACAVVLAACSGSGSKNGNQAPTTPTLALSTTTVTFPSAVAGGAFPAAQTVTVTNSGGGTLAPPTATVAAGGGWLDATVAASEGGFTITLRPLTSGIPPGTQSTTVQVESAGASGSPQAIQVAWQLTAASSPTLVTSPPALAFSAQPGGANPAAQTLVVGNGGGGTLAAISVSDDAAWLTPSIAGTVVTVEVAVGSLSAGAYAGHVTVTSAGAANNPLSVPVSLRVASPTPALSVSPTSLTFTTTPGATPAPKTLTVTNTGGGTLGTVTATPSYTSGSGWMTAAVTGAGNSQTVTVSITTPAAGSYDGSLTISAAGAASSVTVGVHLAVSSGASGDTSTPLGGITALWNANMARNCGKRSSRAQARLAAGRDLEAAAIDAAVTAGRLTYSQANADACIAWINAATCAQLDYGTSGTACETVLAGRVATGNPCSDSAECASGYCAFASVCPGTCTAFKANDVPCTADEQCGSGGVCIGSATGRRCQARTAPGEQGQPCSNAYPWCQVGLYCGFVAGSTTCATSAGEGAPCTVNEQCVAGTNCISTGAGASVCTAIVGEGASCAMANCGDYLYCSSATHTCVPLPIAGEDCSQTGGCDYASGSYCVGTTSRVCTPGTVALGGACSSFSPWTTPAASTLCAGSTDILGENYVTCATPPGGGTAVCSETIFTCYRN